MKVSHIKISGGQNDISIIHGTTIVTEDSSTAVVFPDTLSCVPTVTATPISTDKDHQATVSGKSTGGFTIYMNKSGGGPAGDIEVGWIAVC